MKKIDKSLNLLLLVGEAFPASPLIAPVLGQYSVNIKAFCDEFNAKTVAFKQKTPLIVAVNIFVDKTFEVQIKLSSITYFLKCLLDESNAKQNIVYITQIYEIAKYKQKDFPHIPLITLCKLVIGSASSLHLKIRN